MRGLFWELVNMRTSFPKVYLTSQRIINNKKQYRGKNAARPLSLLVQLLLLFLFESVVYDQPELQSSGHHTFLPTHLQVKETLNVALTHELPPSAIVPLSL